ncbi:hypothetical protein SELMODRAFT_271534 [Selaginella moellendorffii]|uniref:DNA/RNA-binding protein Kin17 WH-like domain-containing protein n=1 Tax=Selaginella moellendorffii TaxID=88036 RepID=D8SFJ4_SELML|nr:KIN17-like protein [Selaginella moellendorffii]EFJ16736.1 hypothetical protein SELMODRAFT_271534 [Selaginella moellendorffii]|eukprot:XP_002982068.1 KIN17-like protein [Selaginella moellendorffii]
MGHDAPYLTPKAIAKRLKAKGLGKQWLYCQMCRKQCRDQNGFKCHCESEGHIRNMELFAEKGDQLIEEYSQRFEDKFMEYMRRCYRSTSVPPNVVYNQITRERNHVRMNGTRWATLSEFVEHLGQTGKCKLEETEKGLHLRFLEDPDHPETQFKEGLKRKRASGEAADIERHEREIQLQRERCLMEVGAKGEKKENSQGLEDEEDEEKQDSVEQEKDGKDGGEEEKAGPTGDVKVAFSFSKKKSSNLPPLPRPPAAATFGGSIGSSSSQKAPPFCWLSEGLVVKVMAKKLKSGAYYKKKGVVKSVASEKVTGEIEMLEGHGEVIRVHQSELETVIPQIGRSVRVVNGLHAGCDAKLVSCEEDKFSVTVEISNGPHRGSIVGGLPYEDVCKLSSPS